MGRTVGGDGIALHSRQGEGQPLVNLMADLDLQLLRPQGTITYTGATRLGNAAFTIDLIFSSTPLAKDQILCTTLDIDHGSEHAAIQTVFTIATPELPFTPPRRLFKEAPFGVKFAKQLQKISIYYPLLLQILTLAPINFFKLCKWQLICTCF